jgi:transposase-like protein/IS1 family transposase
MKCDKCKIECVKFGKHRNGLARFRCKQCGKTYTEPHERLLGAMTVPEEQALAALRMLLEGMSIRAVERITGLHRDTIISILVQTGERCAEFLSRVIRDVPVSDVQADEIWGFVLKKEKHKTFEETLDNKIGDAYCFVAIERNTKLVLTYKLGRRDVKTTNEFIEQVRTATAPGRFQMTTDGFKPYIDAMKVRLWDRANYGMLIKVFATPREGEQRYAPGDFVEALPKVIMGRPELDLICTSHIERQNLTMRMAMRRLTRLTNGFSKKWDNLNWALALHFAYYDFCRVHQTIRVTPAMESGLTDHIWTLRELVETGKPPKKVEQPEIQPRRTARLMGEEIPLTDGAVTVKKDSF